MARSPHRRHKGCYLCKPHRHRGQGQSHRQPASTLRRVGKIRRVTRRDLSGWVD